jgi:RNA polymerase sigma factor (sigma-70 family)
MSEIAELVLEARNRQLTAAERHNAFSELVFQFQDTAFGWAYTVLKDAHLAQDAVQEAFVAAYQNLEQLRQPVAFSGWFKRIVVSQCHRLIRGKQVQLNSIDTAPDLPAPEPAPETAVEDDELTAKIMAAIQTLPEKEQIVTEMYYINGYSQQEIAASLELPLTTVKKRLQYARRNLKGILNSMVDAINLPAKPEPVPVPVPIPVRPYQHQP